MSAKFTTLAALVLCGVSGVSAQQKHEIETQADG